MYDFIVNNDINHNKTCFGQYTIGLKIVKADDPVCPKPLFNIFYKHASIAVIPNCAVWVDPV